MSVLHVRLCCVLLISEILLCSVVDEVSTYTAGYFQIEHGFKNLLHIYKTIKIPTEMTCISLCVETKSCNSFNFNQNLHLCELSGSANVAVRFQNKTEIDERASWTLGFRKQDGKYCLSTVSFTIYLFFRV